MLNNCALLKKKGGSSMVGESLRIGTIVNRYIQFPNNGHSVQRAGGHVRRAWRYDHLLHRVMVGAQRRAFALFSMSIFAEMPNSDGFVAK